MKNMNTTKTDNVTNDMTDNACVVAYEMRNLVLEFVKNANPSQDGKLYAYQDAELVDKANLIAEEYEYKNHLIPTCAAFSYKEGMGSPVLINSTITSASKDFVLIMLANEKATCVYRNPEDNPYKDAITLQPTDEARGEFSTKFLNLLARAARTLLALGNERAFKYMFRVDDYSEIQVYRYNQAIAKFPSTPSSIVPRSFVKQFREISDEMRAKGRQCIDVFLYKAGEDAIYQNPGYPYFSWFENLSKKYRMELGIAPDYATSDVCLYSYDSVNTLSFWIGVLNGTERGKFIQSASILSSARVLTDYMMRSPSILSLNDYFSDLQSIVETVLEKQLEHQLIKPEDLME